MEGLITNATILDHAEGGPEKTPLCMFHITPNEVLALPQYQKWMRSFGGTVHSQMRKNIKQTHKQTKQTNKQNKPKQNKAKQTQTSNMSLLQN